jgi:hypothetical protein
MGAGWGSICMDMLVEWHTGDDSPRRTLWPMSTSTVDMVRVLMAWYGTPRKGEQRYGAATWSILGTCFSYRTDINAASLMLCHVLWRSGGSGPGGSS